MRLFKSKKDKNEVLHHGDSDAQDAPEDPHAGTDSTDTATQPQQPQERSQKFGRGMQAMMNKQTKPASNQDYVQESIGEPKRDCSSELAATR